MSEEGHSSITVNTCSLADGHAQRPPSSEGSPRVEGAWQWRQTLNGKSLDARHQGVQCGAFVHAQRRLSSMKEARGGSQVVGHAYDMRGAHTRR